MAGFKSFSVKEIVIGVLIFVIVIGAYGGLLMTQWYSEKEQTEIKPEKASADQIEVGAKIISVDPVKGDAVARLTIVPKGKYTDDDGYSATTDIQFYVNSETGKTSNVYKKNEMINNMDIVIGLEGDAIRYPFDKQTAELIVSAATSDGTAIPVVLNCYESISGYNIQISDGKDPDEKEENYTSASINISRSLPVISFVCLIMLIKLLLAASALFVMLSVVIRKRKVELAMFSWLAALLFALAPLRNAMPYVPPIGSLNDFASFFWAEGIVAISLVIVVFTWLQRPAAK
jgi:hypothetical protein